MRKKDKEILKKIVKEIFKLLEIALADYPEMLRNYRLREINKLLE